MLRQILVPVAEITGIKPTHLKVLVGLLSFADRSGQCQPQMRTLARVVGMSLSAVRRAIPEMAEAGHLTVRRRFGTSSVYQIAPRFMVSPEAAPC